MTANLIICDIITDRMSALNNYTLSLQPKFAASLQILKVEIGGDDQTTGENNLT